MAHPLRASWLATRSSRPVPKCGTARWRDGTTVRTRTGSSGATAAVALHRDVACVSLARAAVRAAPRDLHHRDFGRLPSPPEPRIVLGARACRQGWSRRTRSSPSRHTVTHPSRLARPTVEADRSRASRIARGSVDDPDHRDAGVSARRGSPASPCPRSSVSRSWPPAVDQPAPPAQASRDRAWSLSVQRPRPLSRAPWSRASGW
jgi:hypothetical protein